MLAPKTISQYPWVIVRVECKLCPRKGCYGLARLAARYGPEFPLARLLAALSGDCPWWRPPERIRKYEPHCGARFVDLDRNLPPADLPPGETVFRQRQPDREDVPQRRAGHQRASGDVPMLSGWPLPVITIVCDRCGRSDAHGVQILLDAGDARLTDVRLRLTADCPRLRAQSIYEQCGARFEMPDV